MRKTKIFEFKISLFRNAEPKRAGVSTVPLTKPAKASEQSTEPKAIDIVEWTRSIMGDRKPKP